jgi:hypothetical protein
MKIVRTPGLGVRVGASESAAAVGPVTSWEHPLVDIFAQVVSHAIRIDRRPPTTV